MPHSRAILVAESDPHAGHKLGLLNPETLLEDDNGKSYYPTLTETQKEIWKIREWGRNETIKLAKNSPVIVMLTGDVNQGMMYDVNDPLAAQIEIGLMNLVPWTEAKNLIAVRISKGTASHSFGNGDAESILAARMKDRFPKIDTKVVSHGLSNIYGVKVDHAHHGPYTGSREWLKGNVALYYLRDIMMRDIMRGKEPPQLVLRGHYHAIVEVFNRAVGVDGKVYRSWLWVLPSLCGMNGYARQKTRSEYEVTNGIIAYEIIDGKLRETFEFTQTFDYRVTEDIL